MPIKQGTPPPKATRPGGSLFDTYVTIQDRKTMAKSPLVWFQLVTEAGEAVEFTKADVAAIARHTGALRPQNFRAASRRVRGNDSRFHMWIQFNPGYWEAINARKGGRP